MQVGMGVIFSLCSWLICLDAGFCCLDSPSMMDCIAWNCELQQSPISTFFFLTGCFFIELELKLGRRHFPEAAAWGSLTK